ncbi:TIP-1 family-domain-containing protein [Infundibulicybe gibba]|nr:TIP-1 family-domain-containing protein [Infundibulicybe gibba]
MTSVQLRTLLAPPDVRESHNRAEIFFDSQIPTLGHLDELEPLIHSTGLRDEELGTELAISTSRVQSLIADSRNYAEQHIYTAQELSLLRHSLNDELLELSQELIPPTSESHEDTLLQDLEALHRALKELVSIKEYAQVIQRALELGYVQLRIQQTNSFITLDSIQPYQTLQDFVKLVVQSCSPAADGTDQSFHFISFLETILDKTWTGMKHNLSSILLESAGKLGWPTPVDYAAIPIGDVKAFESAFVNLLRFQDIGKKFYSSGVQSKDTAIYPIQTLVQPIALRFKYHFDGTRPTNRLDKPEWYFNHILNIIHEHRPFMDSMIQNILEMNNHHEKYAWHEFCYLLFPILSRKLHHTIPSILSHPSLLAHTIYQALAFDSALTEEGFDISLTSAAVDGKVDINPGISGIMLENHEWFDAWISGEKQFADDQYNTLINADDAWLIADDDGVVSDRWNRSLKTTNSSRRMKALIEQITDRYSPLPDINQRLRFLISIQIPQLTNYYQRITSSLEAFETLSSAFVRAVPGGLVSLGGKEEGGVRVDTRRLTSGVEGVQRLCKAYLSSRYIITALEEWGEELFFLELWMDVHKHFDLRAQFEANKWLPNPATETADTPHNTIFEVLLVQFRSLAEHAEDMMVQQVCGEVESGIKIHLTTALSQKPHGEQLEDNLSQTLLAPMSLLSSHLSFICATLPTTTLTSIYRRTASRLAEHILQRQIMYRGHFSQREGKTISAECELWVETCVMALGGGIDGGRGRIEMPWLKLLQAGRLVGLDNNKWEAVVDITFGTQTEEEWQNVMIETIGLADIGRTEAMRILKTRDDCHH